MDFSLHLHSLYPLDMRFFSSFLLIVRPHGLSNKFHNLIIKNDQHGKWKNQHPLVEVQGFHVEYVCQKIDVQDYKVQAKGNHHGYDEVRYGLDHRGMVTKLPS